MAIVVVRNLLRGGSGSVFSYSRAYLWFVLPHGLLAVSIATTFLPDMTRSITRKDKEQMIRQSALGVRLIALVTMPAAFGLFVLRRPIIGAAFEHGGVTPADALETSRAARRLRARPRRVLGLPVRDPGVLRAPGRCAARS